LIYVAAILATACFGFALRLLGVVAVAGEVITTARAAGSCIRDPQLSDIEKEKTVQKASLSLMAGFLSIAGRGVAALAASILLLVVLQVSGLVRVAAVTQWLATWQGVLLTSVVMTSSYFLKIRH
jgi:hypothetical protein